MSSTTALAPRVLDVPAVESPVESAVDSPEPDVLGLGAAGTLAHCVERRRRQDAAAAGELRAVTHWADLHRVGAHDVGAVEPEIGAVEPEIGAAVERRSQVLSLPGLLVMEGELRLAGQGAFRVSEFAVAELAAALQMSDPRGAPTWGRPWSSGTGSRCAGTG